MNDKDVEHMHRRALGGSSAVSGDASKPPHFIEWFAKKDMAHLSTERLCADAFIAGSAFGRADSDRVNAALASQASLAKQGAEPCPDCDGTGVDPYSNPAAPDQCPRCEGAGVVPALAQSAPSEKLTGAEAIQGGFSNPELFDAWSKKLPGVKPTDEQISAFAIGVEVGFEHARDLEKQDWSRVHDVLRKHGKHPGRTDDHLADVIDKALASHAQTVPQVPAVDVEAIAAKHGYSHDPAFYRGVHAALVSLQPEAAGAAQPSEAEIEHWRTAATELRGMTRFNLNMPRIREAARFLEDAYDAARTPTDAGGAKS